MNTQRLWEYQLAKKSLDRAVSVLREFEASVCSPSSPRYDDCWKERINEICTYQH